MRKALFFGIGMLIAFGTLIILERFSSSSAAEKPSKPKLKATVVFPAAKGGEYLPVAFSHTSHSRFGYKKCTDCHDGKLFAEERELGKNKITMDEINKGKFCGACHNGKTKLKEAGKETDEVAFAPTMEGVEMCVMCHNVKTREAPKAEK